MNKARLWKHTIGVTTALAVVISAKSIPVSATLADTSVAHTINSTIDGTTTSLAGISVSLDNYYEGTQQSEVTADEVAKETTTSEVKKTEKQETKKEEKKVSKYEKTGIATVNKYVNIRKKPSTDSEVVGKLYKGGAATILKTEGDWVKVKSGSVTGYITKQYLAIGEAAEKVAEKYGQVYMTVDTQTLRLREKKNTNSRILTLLAKEEKYEVISYDDEWVKVQLDNDTTGYVSKEYVKVDVEFDHAISIQEEREAAERKAAEEAAAREAAAREAAQTSSRRAASSSSSSVKQSTGKKNTTNKANSSSKNTSSKQQSTTTSTSKSGSAVASYATRFVGNPYRWGGTSLTNGADCSGFTQSVYKHFGISLPRTSSAQSGYGKKVSASELQAGDLIFYGNGGSVNHVAIYIGGGKIVHASTRKTGIKISNYNYRSPICIRRVL